MDDIELLVGEILPPTAPYTPWVMQFSQLMIFQHGSDLPLGVQQYAIGLGPSLYHQVAFTTREACLEAIRLSAHASEEQIQAAESAYRKAEESVMKKLSRSSSDNQGNGSA